MVVWITGITGFVGTWVRRELAAVATVSGCARHAVVGDEDVQQVDVLDESAVLDTLRQIRPDTVIHLAACPQPGDRMLRAVNVQGAAHVARALWQVRPDARLVAASTGYVYGNTESPAQVGSPLSPVGEYARSKVEMEAVLQAESVGRDLVVVRAFNHAGPGQGPSYALPAFVRAVRDTPRGAPVAVGGDLSAVRDVSDVRDLARLLGVLATHPSPPPLLHACSGRQTSMGTVLRLVARLAGLGAHTPLLPGPGRSVLRRCVGTPSAFAVAHAPVRSLEDTVADVLLEAGVSPVGHRRASLT